MKIRIGIDVGGTFTDAVAINDETGELVEMVKVPTSHKAKEGVASGIIQSLKDLLGKLDIASQDVVFLAHGTTQATNALLEGDVSSVAIIGLGAGLEGFKAKYDTNVGNIELGMGKSIKTRHQFLNTQDSSYSKTLDETLQLLKREGFSVVVAAEPYSVDNPENENQVLEKAVSHGFASTATHDISKLYGLKVRTRTAVINGSILPRMLETANMTESSIEKAGIIAPLMIMRCDGGVMNMPEVRRRPILTFLSGPAAGVAGALMYERVTDGIFLEVGGTSTDISAIHNGQVVMKFAEIGGHKTYLNSLDVRTLGIAGGSMVRVENRKLLDVGPRSAHIAGVDYSAFAQPQDMDDLEIDFIKPRQGDPSHYLVLKNKQGKCFSITTTCAANYLGFVEEDQYARGNKESVEKAFEALGEYLGLSSEEVARQIMDMSVAKCTPIVKSLITEYELDSTFTELVGGGGGCSVIVPYLAKKLNMKFRLARNAEVISPIGVSLAMVKDVIERTIINPSENDVLRIRRDAEEAALRAGARKETIEVSVEIEHEKNLVRAIAIGSTQIKKKTSSKEHLSLEKLIEKAAESMRVKTNNTSLAGKTDSLFVFTGKDKSNLMWGLLKREKTRVRVLDKDGVIRLQVSQGGVETCSLGDLEQELERGINNRAFYGDGGLEIPAVFVLCGARIVDLSGLLETAQVLSLAKTELSGYDPEMRTVIIYGKRGASLG